MRADIFEVGLALVAVASFSSAVVIFVGSLATAQGTQKPGKPSSPAAQQAGLHELDGLRGTDVVSSAGMRLGELEDVIVDAADGSVDYAVLSIGGLLGFGATRRVVPWATVKLESKIGGATGELLARTHLSPAQIEGAPSLDTGEGIDAELARRSRDAAGLKTPAGMRDGELLLIGAAELEGAPVLGESGQGIGHVERLAVDPRQGCVGYLVVTADESLGLGERRFALPWPILEVARDSQARTEVRSSALTKERLAAAPEFTSDGSGRMYGREWVAEVSSFYHVEPYWSTSVQASAPAGSGR